MKWKHFLIIIIYIFFITCLYFLLQRKLSFSLQSLFSHRSVLVLQAPQQYGSGGYEGKRRLFWAFIIFSQFPVRKHRPVHTLSVKALLVLLLIWFTGQPQWKEATSVSYSPAPEWSAHGRRKGSYSNMILISNGHTSDCTKWKIF